MKYIIEKIGKRKRYVIGLGLAGKKMRVLHFYYGPPQAIRLLRFVQSDLDMGFQPVIFARKEYRHNFKNKLENLHLWIPGIKKVPIEYYEGNRQLSYLLPSIYDKIGLKSVFKKYRCDLVHAHDVGPAYYSYRFGLPTLYDDWEYHYEYFDYQPKVLVARPGQCMHALLLEVARKRVKKIVRNLLRNLSVLVTNEEVEFRYRELGATSIRWVPNVPLSYEREYAFAVNVAKRDKITTCYIGSMSEDERTVLRNTFGVRKLWSEHDIGNLLVFEGKNYVPHLDVLRKIRECHFNLLYWKPLHAHRYYLQNKAFLASVVGVPTIISSSLKATIRLLGEYALPVNSLEDIPKIIKTHNYSRKYRLTPAHLLEYYQSKIKAAYEEALRYD